MEREANRDEILACAAYYEAIGHLEAAYHIEYQIKQSFNNVDHYYNDLTRCNYRVFLRCNVCHYITNAYEQLLRSIIYSEGKGNTKQKRDKMGIYGHGLQDKVRRISHPLIQKFDGEIKKGMRVIKSKMEKSRTKQSRLNRLNQKENFRRFGSLWKMAGFFEESNKKGEVRYRYEILAEGEEISVMGSSDIEMVFTILLVMFDVQSRRLFTKYRQTFHDIRGFLPCIYSRIGSLI